MAAGILLHLGSWLLSVVMVPTHSSKSTNHGRQLAAAESSVIVADHNYAASTSWNPASSVRQLYAAALPAQTKATGRCQPGYTYSPVCAVGEGCLELTASRFHVCLIQKVPEFPGLARLPQLPQRHRLYLAYALPRNPELLSNLLQGV